MANWTQKKLLFTIGGSALTLCLLAGGGIYYTQGLIAEVDAKVADKERALQAADQKIAQTAELEKNVIVLRENLDEYVKILPSEADLTDFVRMLNNFDRQSGVQSKGLQRRQRADVKGESFTPIEYSYDMTATMWQCMKFMNLAENFDRFVSITDVSISGGNSARGEEREGDNVHTVKLTLQTYRYNGKTSGKEVKIPDYDTKKADLQQAIWDNQQKMRLDKWVFRGEQGRRDILVDPRDRNDSRINGPSQADQRSVLERYVTEITRLREIQAKIKKQDTTLFEQYTLEKNLKDGLEKLAASLETDAAQVTYAPYRLRWAKDVVTPFEELRGVVASGAEDLEKKRNLFLAEKEMKQLVADMEADCNSGQLEQAKNRYEAVAGRINVPANDARHALAVEAKRWHVKAATALDFKGLDLKVQGLVVNQTGRSGVLLNGETYEEGEYISDDLLLKKVEEEQIWFVFRGLTLVRTM